MQDQLVQVLTNLGLNEKEAKVYLAGMQSGTAVVSEIAQAAKINRVTTYDILEKLKQRGLVSFFTKKKIKYFTVTDPEVVLQEYEKRTDELRRSMPKFKNLLGETSHPRIRYFEGLEGIKAIYADTLNSSTEILNYSNSHEIRKNWPNYDNEYVKKRIEKNIYLRGICPKDKEGEMVKSLDHSSNREMRLLPNDQFNFSNEINIYDDKVAIISFKDELIGMIIESVEIANSQRAIFNMCWQFAANLPQESEEIKSQPISPPKNIKTKLLNPLKGSELKASVQNHAKTNGNPNKTVLEDNLSLF